MKRFLITYSKNIIGDSYKDCYSFIIEAKDIKFAEAVRFAFCKEYNVFGSVEEI